MDITFTDHGTVWLALGVSEAGQTWFDEHVDFQQWLGKQGVIDHRYAQPIVEAAQAAGMVIEVVRGEG
jgi:hypothetical protein